MPPRGDDLPLTGTSVVDFTTNVPGPQTTQVLRRMGARVLKIEPPRGDGTRVLPTLFQQLNGGKTCVRLDLRTRAGTEQARAAIARADIVVESFRPGVMARFGLGPEALCAAHPRLIYCSISGFGQEGPCSEVPAHDLNVQAQCGLSHLLRDADGTPGVTALPVADFSASAAAVAEILAALRTRDLRGHGAHLDVALVDAVGEWVQTWSAGMRPELGSVLGRPESLIGRAARLLSRSRWFAELERKRLLALPHYGLFRTRDDRHLALGIVDEHKFWVELCAQLELGPLAGLPLPARIALAAPLRAILRRRFSARTLEHWLSRLAETLPVSPVLDPEDARRCREERAATARARGSRGVDPLEHPPAALPRMVP